MSKTPFISRTGVKLVSLAAGLMLAGGAQALEINLGPAAGFSGFIFGNVEGFSDVEGRLAVGGNVASGFDVGYRNPYNSTAPSLVVGGSVSLTGQYGVTGSIYNGPNYNTDTNATIGPAAAQWIGQSKLRKGDLVYGTSLTAVDWQYNTATKNANYINFNAAKTQLTNLSKQLADLSATGTFTADGSGLKLTGDGTLNPQVFNLGNTSLATTITLENVHKDAHIIINSNLTAVDFNGDFGGHLGNSTDALAQHRDRLIYNLSKANSVDVRSFINGTVLAVNADVQGTGHLEGTLIANSVSTPLVPGAGGTLTPRKFELGYEPFAPLTPVPEPTTYALLLAGLAAVGTIARRRKAD